VKVTREDIEQKMDELAREFADTHDPEIPEEIFELARQLRDRKVNAELTSGCLLTPPTSDSAFASASRRILDISHLSADVPDSSLPRTPPLATESNSCKSASACSLLL